jgi:hypothetical protein
MRRMFSTNELYSQPLSSCFKSENQLRNGIVYIQLHILSNKVKVMIKVHIKNIIFGYCLNLVTRDSIVKFLSSIIYVDLFVLDTLTEYGEFTIVKSFR